MCLPEVLAFETVFVVPGIEALWVGFVGVVELRALLEGLYVLSVERVQNPVLHFPLYQM
jgi:hypothetical protein